VCAHFKQTFAHLATPIFSQRCRVCGVWTVGAWVNGVSHENGTGCGGVGGNDDRGQRAWSGAGVPPPPLLSASLSCPRAGGVGNAVARAGAVGRSGGWAPAVRIDYAPLSC